MTDASYDDSLDDPRWKGINTGASGGFKPLIQPRPGDASFNIPQPAPYTPPPIGQTPSGNGFGASAGAPVPSGNIPPFRTPPQQYLHPGQNIQPAGAPTNNPILPGGPATQGTRPGELPTYLTGQPPGHPPSAGYGANAAGLYNPLVGQPSGNLSPLPPGAINQAGQPTGPGTPPNPYANPRPDVGPFSLSEVLARARAQQSWWSPRCARYCASTGAQRRC